MTTQRRLRWGKKPKQDTPRSILVDDQDGAVEATEFVYAVAAALGLVPRQRTEAANEPRVVKIAVIGTTLHAEDRQWHYLEEATSFQQWLSQTYFPRPPHSTDWAVVQTGADTYPLLSAAMAYAVCNDTTLLIDADTSGTLSQRILSATDKGFQVLDIDEPAPSPQICLLNAPHWAGLTLLLQADEVNPLGSKMLPDTLAAAHQHFKHVVINCGADLFRAQLLAAKGVRVIHVDDCSRPLYANFQPHKKVDYHRHRVPTYGKHADFGVLAKTTRKRKALRRWMQRGDQE